MKTRKFGISGFQIIAMAMGLASANAFASPTTINFATGQDSSGNIQTTGDSLDANWKESTAANPKNPPNSYVVAPNNADWHPGDQITDPGWFSNGPNSSWIAPNPDNANGNGNYTLTHTFNLSGYDLNTASFNNLQWAIDDGGSVKLNGHTEATIVPPDFVSPLPVSNWNSFHSFTIPINHLLPTTNTLTITSTGSDIFLEASRLEGTLTISPIPEPETYAMLLAGLSLVTFIARRRKSA